MSFVINNHDFEYEEFFVQDLFTLKNWIQALQQHIIDIRKTFQNKTKSTIYALLFFAGEWQCTFEHQPSTRRFSYQSSTSSTIQGQNLTNKSMLKNKTRSLGIRKSYFFLSSENSSYYIFLDDLPCAEPTVNNNNDSVLEYHTYL